MKIERAREARGDVHDAVEDEAVGRERLLVRHVDSPVGAKRGRVDPGRIDEHRIGPDRGDGGLQVQTARDGNRTTR